MTEDLLTIGGHTFSSRFILGSGKYSYDLIDAAVKNAQAQIITMALRRNVSAEENILNYIPADVTILPNTSGSTTAEEAIRTARIARELSGSDFVKLEVVPDKKYLMPDNYETLKATEVLAKEGFIVMPYVLPDLNVPIVWLMPELPQ